MAKLHGFARNSQFITDFDGEFEERDVNVSKRPRYLRQISTTESPSNPIDPHRVETKDEWVETHDVVVTVSTTKKAYDNYRWNEERIQRLESTIARFVKELKGYTPTAVAGKYSMDAEQMDVFNSLNKDILDEARKSEDARLREFRVVSRSEIRQDQRRVGEIRTIFGELISIIL